MNAAGRAIGRSWEDFSMLRRGQARQLALYREQADEVHRDDSCTVFRYGVDHTLPARRPSATEVLLDDAEIGRIDRPNPLWGRCQNCASRKILRATHSERRHLGSATVRCGACGTLGSVRFFVNNGQTDVGWVADRYASDDEVRYRVTGARNRCYAPSYRGIDAFFEITENVPCKRSRSIISLDHRPQVWKTDDGTYAGLFLTEEGQQRWRDEEYNPHDKIDFSRTRFTYPEPTIIVSSPPDFLS